MNRVTRTCLMLALCAVVLVLLIGWGINRQAAHQRDADCRVSREMGMDC